MSKVTLLPEDVISKIAAGEVIERPASVIKELVENALDAGATRIAITLKDAGKTLIEVADNGSGIAHDDLEKIFLRHSTSKIKTADDLFAITSMGFRGEALYSVASIADIIVTSRTAAQDTGWEVHMRGGKRLSLRPAATATTGTTLTVQELFFNTPARKKFLKSDHTELTQIINTLIPYTLLYPTCQFSLTHNDKTLIDLSTTNAHSDRIAAALELDQKNLIDTQDVVPEEQLSARLILGDINTARSRRDMQFIFVNNRPVFHKNISFHMNNTYRLILPDGSFPFFAVYVDVPPDSVDVNIHPTKREVKMRNEQPLMDLIRRLCEDGLMQKSRPKNITAAPGRIEKSDAPLFHFEPTTDREIAEPCRGTYQPPTQQYTFPQTPRPTFPTEQLFAHKQDSLQGKLEHGRYIGSFLNKYLLFESDTSLLLVDQHAAQERIVFEQLITHMQKGTIEVQRLLSPQIIKLAVTEMLSWEIRQEDLKEVGFETTQLGENSIGVHTYPVLVPEIEKAVREILADGIAARCDHETLARRACRSSVMAGDRLTSEQAEHQRTQLLACLDPFTCPHGRPIVIEIDEEFLQKQFLRT